MGKVSDLSMKISEPWSIEKGAADMPVAEAYIMSLYRVISVRHQ